MKSIFAELCKVGNKKWPYLRLHTTHALAFWYSKNYSIKNQVRGLCVDGDMAILFFAHFTQFCENCDSPFVSPVFFHTFIIYKKLYFNNVCDFIRAPWIMIIEGLRNFRMKNLHFVILNKKWGGKRFSWA